MAESKNNIITHGLSGKVGNMLVFSQRNDKTIVSQAAKKSAEEQSILIYIENNCLGRCSQICSTLQKSSRSTYRSITDK